MKSWVADLQGLTQCPEFSAYYVMITYLYDALSFLKHFLTFQLLNIIATVVLDHGVSVFKKCHQINVSELKVT